MLNISVLKPRVGKLTITAKTNTYITIVYD